MVWQAKPAPRTTHYAAINRSIIRDLNYGHPVFPQYSTDFPHDLSRIGVVFEIATSDYCGHTLIAEPFQPFVSTALYYFASN